MSNDFLFTEYDELLLLLAGQSDNCPDKLTALYPMVGWKYAGKLMVVGRSVNGWRVSWEPAEGIEPEFRKNTYLEAKRQSEYYGNRCPMLWVTDSWGVSCDESGEGTYNTKKSAFWRVIRKLVLERLRVTDSSIEWASHIVWSNLYKVSPVSEGNPSEHLCKIQRDLCIRILEKEIHQFEPEKIVFLTGKNWSDELTNAISGFEIQYVDFGHTQGIGTFKWKNREAQVVVAKHPQGKNEMKWLDGVSKGFELLSNR